MASTRTQSVCDLLKGKDTNISEAQLDKELSELTNLGKSENESENENKRFQQLNKEVKDELNFEQNIKNIKNKLIFLYYIHNPNFKDENERIRQKINKIKNLESAKIKMFEDIKKANIQIAEFLFPQEKFNEDELIDIKTKYIYTTLINRVLMNNNLFNNYKNLKTILTFKILNNLNKNLISLLKYLQKSTHGGSIKIKNNQKTIKNNQKQSKTIKKIIKKTIKKKCKTIKGLYLYKIYDIGNYNDGDLDKNNKKKEYTIWDCAKGFVICARNENNARQLITNNKNELTVGDEINYRKDFWLNSSFTKCESIGNSCLSKEQIILRDFQDG